MTHTPRSCNGCNKIGTESCPYDVWCYNQDGCDYISPYKRTQEFKDFAEMCGLSCHSEMLASSCQTCVNEMAHFCNGCPGVKKDKDTHDQNNDLLVLLEEWDYLNNRNFLKPHPVFADMIKHVRENPEGVRAHLDMLKRETQS